MQGKFMNMDEQTKVVEIENEMRYDEDKFRSLKNTKITKNL